MASTLNLKSLQPLELFHLRPDADRGRYAVQRRTGTVTSVERIWHIKDSLGQILTLGLRLKSLESCELSHLRSKADQGGGCTVR